MTRRNSVAGAVGRGMEEDPGKLVAQILGNQVRVSKSVAKTLLSKSSGDGAIALAEALLRGIVQGLRCLEAGFDAGPREADCFKTPSPPRRKRKRQEELAGHREEERGIPSSRQRVMAGLRGCVLLLQAGLSQCKKFFHPARLLPVVQGLHEKLVVLEDDPELQDAISELCELWWREGFDGKESLIAQSLPFLMSRSLTSNRKVDVHRVYAVREAFFLFDFLDGSIEDLRHLLIRSVVTPAFLRSAEGRRFISFLFGLNPQLVKELNALMHSQIPFGRKSILEAYGDILYRAWKGAAGEILVEIEKSCLQVLVEGAIYAASKTLSSACRKVLEGFISQRAEAGVEGMLFRLQEPLLFRSLQVANSNVRRNAILLLIDMFPLQHPEASKEEKEALIERQFALIEKLLLDPCPDVRSVTVEGACRILRLFWEIIPAANTAKLLTKIVNDIPSDQSSSSARLAVLEGVTYLLENPHSHDILKILLPRLSPMLNDPAVTVRTAAVDLLLAVKGIRGIPFHKVARLDSLLSMLADDCDTVARRLTRLLIPSYFPTKARIVEACNRCCTLIKRSPSAGARFCSYASAEGVPAESLFELLKFLCGLALPDSELDQEHREGVLLAVSELGMSLVSLGQWKIAVGSHLTGQLLMSLLGVAATSQTRSSIVRLASSLPAKDIPELAKYCGDLVITSAKDLTVLDSSNEIRAVNSFVLSWGGFEDLAGSLVDKLARFRENTSLQEKPGSSRRNAKAKASRVKTRSSPRQKNCDTLFTAAVGAAWHVQIFLAESDTRKALLAYRGLQDLISRLRQLAEYCMKNVETVTNHRLISSAITAYANLTIHICLERKKDGNVRTSTGRRKRHRVDVSTTTPVSNPLDGFEDVSEDLINLALEMLDRLQTLQGNIAVYPLHAMKMASATLRSVLEALNLGLSSNGTLHSKTMRLACSIFTTIQAVVRGGAAAENLQEILPCLKASASYTGKLLFLCRRDRGPHYAEEPTLAHDVLDTLAVIEQHNVGSCVSLLPALRQWIPDIVAAVSEKVDSSDTETVPAWVKHVAAASNEAPEGSEENNRTRDDGNPDNQVGSVDLTQSILKALPKASREVQEAFVCLLARHTVSCFEGSDYDEGVGLVHLICRRILRSKASLSGSLQDDFTRVYNRLSSMDDERFQATILLVKEVLLPCEK
ncbi:condensin-2 complex subunit G2 [Selaginella moellendorffii]|nr:condensin-2 complex subunit G2 [Selaginella moellendorffii]|eukprot:XP_002980805.2 condensin-2 complex subunit G2 [Selaginella moellendorffii]